MGRAGVLQGGTRDAFRGVAECALDSHRLLVHPNQRCKGGARELLAVPAMAHGCARRVGCVTDRTAETAALDLHLDTLFSCSGSISPAIRVSELSSSLAMREERGECHVRGISQHRRPVRDHPDHPVDAAAEADPVPNELIRKILEAGVCAPSGGNMQRWRFLAVRDLKVKETVGALY
jgi:Nitroreductase family